VGARQLALHFPAGRGVLVHPDPRGLGPAEFRTG
jgi:hypothetical protein